MTRILLAISTLSISVFADPPRSCQFLGGPDLIFVSKTPEALALRDGMFREGNVERIVQNGELVKEKTYNGVNVAQEKTYSRNKLVTDEIHEPNGNLTRTEYRPDGTIKEVVQIVNGIIDSERVFNAYGDGTLTQYDIAGKATFVSQMKHWGKVTTTEKLSTYRSQWQTADGTQWHITGWSLYGSKRANFHNPESGATGFVELKWQTPHGKFLFELPTGEGRAKNITHGQYVNGMKTGEWLSRSFYEGGIVETVSVYVEGKLQSVITTTKARGQEDFVVTMLYNSEGLLETYKTTEAPFHPASTTIYSYGESTTTVSHFHGEGPIAKKEIVDTKSGRVTRETIYEGVENRDYPLVIVYEPDTGRLAQRLEPTGGNPGLVQTNYYESGLMEVTRQPEGYNWAETTISSELGKIVLRQVEWNTRTGEIREESKFNQNGQIYEHYLRHSDHSVITMVGPPYLVFIDFDSGTHVSYQISDKRDSLPRKSDTIPRNSRNNKQIIEELIHNWR